MEEIINKLRIIDEDEDVEVTDWEASFLETVLNQDWLSVWQKPIALKIIEKYSSQCRLLR